MKDILTDVMRVWDAGDGAAVATVVVTTGSSPRTAGAAMMLAADGVVAGSVSGGCIEAPTYDGALGIPY